MERGRVLFSVEVYHAEVVVNAGFKRGKIHGLFQARHGRHELLLTEEGQAHVVPEEGIVRAASHSHTVPVR